MERYKVLLILLLLAIGADGQTIKGVYSPNRLPSLQKALETASDDTTKIKALTFLCEYYSLLRYDSAIYYVTQEIELSEKAKDVYAGFTGYLQLCFILNTTSDYPKALEMALKSLKLAEQLTTKRKESIAESYHHLGLINNRLGNDSIALSYCLKSIQLFRESGIGPNENDFGPPTIAGLIYLKRHKLDSALYYAEMSYNIALHYTNQSLRIEVSTTCGLLGGVYVAMQNYRLARQYYLIGLNVLKEYPVNLLTVRYYNIYARFLEKTGNTDSCIFYARIALQLCGNRNYGEHASDAASILTGIYEIQKMPDSSLKYLKIMLSIRDTIINQTKTQQAALLNLDESQREKAIEAEKERYRNQVRFYALISAAAIFLLLSGILYRNNWQKQKANKVLQITLSELKSTQAQLIQSEKMASLGELTAGIAHEIQNPLNFVNNFSEVNKEMIDELLSEKSKVISERNEELENELLNDIKANEEKINHHGKRADAIVKGMLQHSQKSSGQKELTDINALCDEYLRLSYHGLRAKDKSFNADFKTDFDNSIDKINIIPQDISRVLLNLYNNAFYAVNEKKQQSGNSYQPVITVSTKKTNGSVEIKVADNGNGIPESIKDKIFQPFFTTKPTGEGTGLGLSLSYDIVKADGGEITVETKEGEGSEFIIQLPIVN